MEGALAIARIARLGSGSVSAISATAVILAALVVLLLWFSSERRRIVEQGARNGFNLAHVLKEQVAGMVSAVDLTFKGISDTLTLLPDLAEHDSAFEESLRQKLLRLPYVRAIFIIGADGFITQDTDHPFTPRRNLADRDYFTVHAELDGPPLFIGPPLQSRSTGTWFISVSRRLDAPDGTFAGVVVAALEVNRFAAFYRLIDLGPHDAISLFHRNGTFLLRVPEGKPTIGQSMGHLPLFREHLPSTPNGSFRSTATFDGRARLISYRMLDNAPLVVTVALDEVALLGGWRRNLIVSTCAFIAFAVSLAGLVVIFVRSRSRHRRAREQELHAQRLETLGRMTGGIAHDVNNCLAIMSSGLRLLKRQGVPESDTLARMNESVAHCAGLMKQLLMFARRQPLDLRAIDIADRLEKLKPLVRQAVGPEIKIASEVPADLWPCRADQTQFDAAILNLAVNAADAMPSGGWLRIAARNLQLSAHANPPRAPEGDYVEVCVADTGMGMPPETVRRAIEPFFSTKGEGGTGLGLSQVYGFMQQIGGDLRIESKVGQGTSVYLIFPRGAAAQATRPLRPAQAGDGEGADHEARAS
jgi:two-component system NtrC family sensor kinase